MFFELGLVATYRILALIIAMMMFWIIFREKDWQRQIFATLILIPFALRAAGVK